MNKFKGAVAVILAAIIVSAFVACKSEQIEYSDKPVTVTQAVTDENGEGVTGEDGEIVTEAVTAVVVTDSKGQTVTEVVTNKNGTAVTKPNGEKVTQAVTTVPEKTTDKNEPSAEKTSSKNNKTTKKETTTKKNSGSSENNKPNSTKPNSTKPNSTKPSDTTTTTTEPPTAPDEEDVDEKDLTVNVVLPFFSAEDARNYKLVLTIDNGENEKDTVLEWSFVGCKGQGIEIAVPKEYKGKTGIFSVDVQGKNYSLKRTIKNGLSVDFETIIVIEGVDD